MATVGFRSSWKGSSEGGTLRGVVVGILVFLVVILSVVERVERVEERRNYEAPILRGCPVIFSLLFSSVVLGMKKKKAEHLGSQAGIRHLRANSHFAVRPGGMSRLASTLTLFGGAVTHVESCAMIVAANGIAGESRPFEASQ